MDFAAQLRLFADKTSDKIDRVVRKVVIDLGTGIIELSPVGNPELWAANAHAVRYNADVANYNADLRTDPANLTKAGRLRRGLKLHDSVKFDAGMGYVGGHFIANWQYGLDAMPANVLDVIDRSPDGAETSSALAANVAGSPGSGHVHYIVNRVPYGPRLEDGWSTQAPAGMVGLTALRFNAIVENAVQEVRDGPTA